jgi:hypothetical protein
MSSARLGAAGTPGWYQDPYDASLQRYWTGDAWTDNTVPRDPPDLA